MGHPGHTGHGSHEVKKFLDLAFNVLGTMYAMESSHGQEPPVPPVIWMLPDQPARGPKPAHSREQIAAAAIAIADAEGLDAVTMRRVAADVGCGTMTLYRYVPTKDHLLDLMVDATAAELIPAEPGTGDWRADLRAAAYRERGRLLRHPWLASLQAGRPSFGPNSLRLVEYGLGLIDHLGLDIDAMLVTFDTLVSFVRGSVIAELAGQEARRRSGLDVRQWQASVAPYVRMLIDSGQYPMFTRIVEDAKLPHLDNGADEQFRRALEHVLDGLAANLPGPPGEVG
jgi:AcrR family transcriptional regulator